MPWTLPVFRWICLCSRHFYLLDLETEMMTNRKCEKEVETVHVYVCVCVWLGQKAQRENRENRQAEARDERDGPNERDRNRTMEAHTETKGMFTLVVETLSTLHGFFVRPSRQTHLSPWFNDRTLNLRTTFFVIWERDLRWEQLERDAAVTT